MTDDRRIIHDDKGHPRHFRFSRNRTGDVGAATAQQAAKRFLAEHAQILQLPQFAPAALDVRPAIAPGGEQQALHFETEKRLMDSTIVSYCQTVFGLPVHQAGLSVIMQAADNRVRAASSTLQYGITVQPPGPTVTSKPPNAAANGGYDDLVRKAIPAAADMRINRTRLLIYRYNAAARRHGHPKENGDSGPAPPTLPVSPVPASIVDGRHYIVVEALFSLPHPRLGMLNWRASIEPESGGVLYLEALTANATGYVFDRDPMTKTGDATYSRYATSAVLDTVRDNVTLHNLIPGFFGQQALAGSFVSLDYSAPLSNLPVENSPYIFDYSARSDEFAAVNAYYHCDRFFRMVRDAGFDLTSYFDGTVFPLPVEPRGLGNDHNSQCLPNTLLNGIGVVKFGLAETVTLVPPMGMAADWRVVLHELGGHGILYDQVESGYLGFSHSAGDGIAAILNDPDTQMASNRSATFPWTEFERQHQRWLPDGWGWGGVQDDGNYGSEQILASCHFRLYRSIGGDSTYQPRRVFAARSAVYLILRTLGQLTPATNPPDPLTWEQQLETADAFVWTPTDPAETHAGGAYHKVIRWAFEKQGLFRSQNDPPTEIGKPPETDVYIDDGMLGEYWYQPNHWSCTDIWNRQTVGAGGGVHETPSVGQTNFAYVRIKNRGTQPATNIVVKAFHCLPGVGLEFPADWLPMTTPQLGAADLAAGDNVGAVVGPFEWTPTQVGHECMLFSVSADGDPGNIDGHVIGPIPEWRLVPYDNNIAQRNVQPMVLVGVGSDDWPVWPFWIRNHGKQPVLLGVDIKQPAWLARLGWKFDIPQIGKETTAKPGELLKVAIAMTRGKPFEERLLATEPDHDIVVTVLHDGMPVGGMTFRITPPGKA